MAGIRARKSAGKMAALVYRCGGSTPKRFPFNCRRESIPKLAGGHQNRDIIIAAPRLTECAIEETAVAIIPSRSSPLLPHHSLMIEFTSWRGVSSAGIMLHRS